LGYSYEKKLAAPPRSALSRRLKFVIPLVIGLALLCGGGLALLAFQGWILPEISAQRQANQLTQLHNQAQSALASGDYERAVLAYNNILQLQPDNPQALAGLEQASQLRVTASLYSEAIVEMEAHHWENALKLLRQIGAEQPGYRDVADRINFVNQQQQLTELFNQAESAFTRQNYGLAIEKYETLQSIDYGFQSDAVQKHLFLNYLQLGLAQEQDARSDAKKLQAALNTLDKALLLRPDDSQTRGETQLLKQFLVGIDDHKNKNWPQAIEQLEMVYQARADFAGGSVGPLLYEAYMLYGDELFANQQLEKALAMYHKAGLMPEANQPNIAVKIAITEEALLPPAPTPPAPTPAPVANRGAEAAASVRTLPDSNAAAPSAALYALKGMSIRNNCSGFGYIHGVVWTAYNMPLAGVSVQAFNTTTGTGPLVSNPTNGDGVYQIILNGDQIQGVWTVQVVDENGQPASQAWGQRLGGECLNGAQELKVDWQQALQIGE
jgi:tetratricopeptide (TPR) repeat protein